MLAMDQTMFAVHWLPIRGRAAQLLVVTCARVARRGCSPGGSRRRTASSARLPLGTGQRVLLHGEASRFFEAAGASENS